MLTRKGPILCRRHFCDISISGVYDLKTLLRTKLRTKEVKITWFNFIRLFDRYRLVTLLLLIAERFCGQVLTKRRYTNVRPLPFLTMLF